MNRYDHTFTAVCPNDGRTIIYHLTVKSDTMIPVETIEATCIFGAAFHEKIADELLAKLGGRQKLTAMHQETFITTKRGPAQSS